MTFTKRVLLIFTCLSFATTIVKAQGLMVYEEKIEGVKKNYKKFAKKIKASYEETVSGNGDTLIIYIGCEGGNTNKFLFSKTTGYCIYQSVEYNCMECTEKSIESILYDMREWRQVGKNKYISDPLYRTGLIVETVDEKPKKIIFKYIDADEEEYKARFNSLEELPKRSKK